MLHSDDDAACRILVRFTPLIGDALNRDQTFYFIERIRFILRQGDFKVWCAMLEWNRSQSRSFDAVVIERDDSGAAYLLELPQSLFGDEVAGLDHRKA